jgi:hypothetical protein
MAARRDGNFQGDEGVSSKQLHPWHPDRKRRLDVREMRTPC